MASTAKQLLEKHIKLFIILKRSHEFHKEIYRRNRNKLIKNDILLNHYGLAFDGLITRFNNFNTDVLDNLRNRLPCNHRSEFAFKKLMKKATAHGEENSTIIHLHIDNDEAAYVDDEESSLRIREARAKSISHTAAKVYKRVFPNVVRRLKSADSMPDSKEKENLDRPIKEDFILLADKFQKITHPIRAHRDTCSAHWDKKRIEIDARRMALVFSQVQKFLADLYFATEYASYSFELAGYAASIKDTEKLYSAILRGQRPLD